MFQKILLFTTLLLASAVQISLFPNIFFGKPVPEIILILVIFWASQKGFEKIWKQTVLAGFVLDVFCIKPIGLNVISLSLCAFVSNSLAKRFLTSQKTIGFFMIMTFVILGTLINIFVLDFVAKAFEFSLKNAFEALMLDIKRGDFFWKLAINSIFFAILYWPMIKFEKFLSFYQKGFDQERFIK